jgi:hypothetical protein
MAQKPGDKNKGKADPKEPQPTTDKDQKMPETTIVEVAVRPVVTAETAYGLSTDQIDAAIKAGYIRWAGGIPRGEKKSEGSRESSVTPVTIKAGVSPTKQDETQSYEKLEAITDVGEVLLAGGKAEPAILRGDEKVDPRSPEERAKGSVDHFNYGLDLEVKRAIRKALENEISGPEKAIQRMAKVFLDLKLAKNLEQALAKARKQYEDEIAEQGETDTDEDQG